MAGTGGVGMLRGQLDYPLVCHLRLGILLWPLLLLACSVFLYLILYQIFRKLGFPQSLGPLMFQTQSAYCCMLP